ncbi:MAG: hypothetical protein GDA56_29030 [Hormoscilla sp. GM7CHS1pb]|nr:hypothetical protein [Hormoscilla sp. GM7CHS1pb]
MKIGLFSIRHSQLAAFNVKRQERDAPRDTAARIRSQAEPWERGVQLQEQSLPARASLQLMFG